MSSRATGLVRSPLPRPLTIARRFVSYPHFSLHLPHPSTVLRLRRTDGSDRPRPPPVPVVRDHRHPRSSFSRSTRSTSVSKILTSTHIAMLTGLLSGRPALSFESPGRRPPAGLRALLVVSPLRDHHVVVLSKSPRPQCLWPLRPSAGLAGPHAALFSTSCGGNPHDMAIHILGL